MAERFDVRHDDHIWDNQQELYVCLVNDETKAQQVADRLNRTIWIEATLEELSKNGEISING